MIAMALAIFLEKKLATKVLELMKISKTRIIIPILFFDFYLGMLNRLVN